MSDSKQILKDIENQCREFYGMNGLRFMGISIEQIKQIFKQHGVEIERPF